jgi:hypothetical protein
MGGRGVAKPRVCPRGTARGNRPRAKLPTPSRRVGAASGGDLLAETLRQVDRRLNRLPQGLRQCRIDAARPGPGGSGACAASFASSQQTHRASRSAPTRPDRWDPLQAAICLQQPRGRSIAG